MGGSNIMQLDKMSIDIEKIGNMEIFSHNGYILGFRDKKYSDSISFFPIVTNKEEYNRKDFEMYLDFIDMVWTYSNYEYDPNYNIYFKEYNKVYNVRNKYDVRELIELSSNCNICITPEYCFELIDLIDNLMDEFSSKDESITVNSTQGNKIITKTLELDDDNYIQIRVNYFEQYFMSYHSTSGKIDDIVKIFEHVFKMLDKNLRKGD